MAAKKGTAAWKREYRDVIVGIHNPTKTVGRIYIQNDGGMSRGYLVHYPMPGRSAEHEALVVFGFAKAKSFSISSEPMIDGYAEKLRQELLNEPQESQD